jgi:hypothetical protein
MKTKTAILATALGLALASSAGAQTTVLRLTGSTAFRGSVHDAIRQVMTNETYAYFGAATLNSSTRANFLGTINGQSVLIQVAWSGSAAGVQSVAKNLDVAFLPAATVGTTSGVQVTDTTTETDKADAAFSDVFQASTAFTSPALVDNKVCVVPFVWIANDGAPATLTNVTPGLAQSLYTAQNIPLALFTGLTSDRTANTQVYCLGRDPSSGTRITMTAESGLGAFATVFQNSVTLNTGADTISNPVPFPQGTTVFADGDNGYSSGGGLAAALAAKSGDGNVYLGYLGLGDATATAIPGGARALSWNGVPYSAAAVTEGQYTFWGYEHLFYLSSLDTTKKAIATTVKNQVAAVPGAAGLLLNSMNVSRVSDGAPVGADY